MKGLRKTRGEITPLHRGFTGHPARSGDGGRGATGVAGQLVFGVEPVRELLAAGHPVETLYVSYKAKHRFAAEMNDAREAGGKIVVIDDGAMRRLCGPEARHQGLAAVCREFQYAQLDTVIASAADPLLVIDGVTDPRNLGAIMRSAEGAGVRAMVLARDRTAEVSATAIKASAGARAHLTIARCGNVAGTLEMLKEHGYWVGGLAPGGGCSLYDLDVNRRLALVLGGEQHGLRPLVARSCDFLVAIPMYGKVASLNVAVAAAVALFEIAHRRAIFTRVADARRAAQGER